MKQESATRQVRAFFFESYENPFLLAIVELATQKYSTLLWLSAAGRRRCPLTPIWVSGIERAPHHVPFPCPTKIMQWPRLVYTGLVQLQAAAGFAEAFFKTEVSGLKKAGIRLEERAGVDRTITKVGSLLEGVLPASLTTWHLREAWERKKWAGLGL